MTDSIWPILAGTPWWVYALFIYLIILGIKATQPRIVHIKKLFILPSLFVGLSLVGMYASMEITFVHIALWLLAICLGTGLGWLQYHFIKIKAIKHTQTLQLPGTYSVLIIILVIFTTKYYFGYEMAVDPQTLNQPKFAALIFFLYGLFTGLFVGRALYALRCLKVGPYV